MRNVNKIASLLAGAVLMLGGGQAMAATLQVDADVQDSCINVSGTLDFGNYTPLVPGNFDTTGTITLTCTAGSDAKVALNGGHSNDITARTLDGPGSYELPYQLYTTTNRDVIWGDDANGVSVTQAGTGSPMNMTVFARIPEANDAPVGSYTDSVTISVSF